MINFVVRLIRPSQSRTTSGSSVSTRTSRILHGSVESAVPADDVRDGFDLTFQVLGVVIDVEFDGYEDDAAFVFSLLPEADVSLVPRLGIRFIEGGAFG